MSTSTRRPVRRDYRSGQGQQRRRGPVPSRRRALTRRWLAVLVALAVLGAGYLVLFSPVLGVREVEVTGVRTLSAEQVRAAANVPRGAPLLRLSTDTVRGNVAELPGVAEVEVSRSLPGTLSIEVTERPVVAVFRAEDGLRLVDSTGEPLRAVPRRPRGLPVLRLPEVSAADERTGAALDVLVALPEELREKVRAVAADTPGDVRLTFAGGRAANWGDARDSARKAAVLGVLLTRKGRVFDVASPSAPTVR